MDWLLCQLCQFSTAQDVLKLFSLSDQKCKTQNYWLFKIKSCVQNVYIFPGLSQSGLVLNLGLHKVCNCKGLITAAQLVRMNTWSTRFQYTLSRERQQKNSCSGFAPTQELSTNGMSCCEVTNMRPAIRNITVLKGISAQLLLWSHSVTSMQHLMLLFSCFVSFYFPLLILMHKCICQW